jgi:hypothetical protein
MSEEEAMLQRERMSPVRNGSRDRVGGDTVYQRRTTDDSAAPSPPDAALPEKPTRVDEEIRRKTVDRVAYFKDVRVLSLRRVRVCACVDHSSRA